MDEAEWLASADPAAMLELVTPGRSGGVGKLKSQMASDRQLRLFTVACCRAVWDRLSDERSRRAVEVAEQYAEGLATDEERQDAWRLSQRGSIAAYACWVDIGIADAAATIARDGMTEGPTPPPATQAALLRCIVGNPFVPVVELDGGGQIHHGWASPISQQTVIFDRAWLAHGDGLLVRIARSIYDRRAWGDMALLADALEDSGCTDDVILAHCREVHNACPLTYAHQPHDYCDGSQADGRVVRGLHARGCWVVDLILGQG